LPDFVIARYEEMLGRRLPEPALQK
jgi:hypothetical protein